MTDRGLDHVVHVVRDLDAAKARFEAMGFTATPQALHPFGTGNSLILLRGAFIELLDVVHPEKIQPAPDGHYSFAMANRDFRERREGVSMLVLRSEDARADHARFVAAGLPTYPPFDFARMAGQPDGSEKEVSFSLCFVVDPAMPDAGYFVCQQHKPENFWHPVYQSHPNGARRMARVVKVAPDPSALTGHFTGLFGEAAVAANGGRLTIDSGDGTILVLPPDQLAQVYPECWDGDLPGGVGFLGYAVAVSRLDETRSSLSRGGVAPVDFGDRLVVPPSAGFGAMVEFIEEK